MAIYKLLKAITINTNIFINENNARQHLYGQRGVNIILGTAE